ncbi:MAG: cytochrome c [Candidatus Krumholzibacteria bacterium]|nr:cytochrome c [Candidatus Krumholzibacteria bacterium]
MVALHKRTNLWFILAAAFVVTGCGGGTQDEKTSDTKSTQTTTAETAEVPRGDAGKGTALFVSYCSACHGADAKGLKGLGRDLTQNEWVQSLSDAEFLEYVNTGRGVDDPRNTSGIPMPPKGGNPALTDQEIMHIIAHVRTLQ